MSRTRSLLAVASAVAGLLVLAGNAAAVTETGSGSAPAAGGTLRVSFVDDWQGAGQQTWTIDSSRSMAEWVFIGPVPPNSVQLSLTDEYCFSKYGFGGVSVSGSGIAPGGAVAESGCGARSGSAAPDSRSITNSGNVIGRGNAYGRWIWFQHKAQASLRYLSSNYFAEAYHRSSPMGGHV